ncbi:efflux RND transporter permease subunit [Planctobacterium marinum]
MNLTELAFNYRKPVFLVLILLLLNGLFAYFTLPAKEDPTITIRTAVVSTRYEGMSPERVEQLITRKIEEEIRKIPEVDKIRSTSSTGLSTIHVEVYDRYFDLDLIWQDLRNKVQQAQSKLPSGTQASFVNDSYGDVAVATLALTADGFSPAEMDDISTHIRDVLYSVPGTEKVDISGAQDERIFLEASGAKLSQLGISPWTLNAELAKQNIIMPGGQIDTGSKAFVVEPTGNFNSIDEIGDTHISIPGLEETIALKDIVEIKRDYRDPVYQPAYFNGKPAIMIAVNMAENYNILEYAPRLKAKIDEIMTTLPIGYNIDIATWQAEQVDETVSSVSVSVMQTLVIVLLVVILFLGKRTGLIVGSIIPFVMLVTLAIMHFSGMILERMSLATLIIALGLLVDNGIVVAEDFKRRLEQGETRKDAMFQGGKELAMPLLSSSLTTILFFIPLMLAEHAAGEYTRSISLVILITLLSSWLLALCVTPTLCYYFIKVDSNSDDSAKSGIQSDNSMLKRVQQYYEGMLTWMLNHRLLFSGIMMGIFILSILGFNLVSQQFFPDSDRNQLTVTVEMANGTSSRTTNKQMQAIFAWLNDTEQFPEIDRFSGYVGYGGPRFVLSLNPIDPADNKGFIVINLKDAEQVSDMQQRLHRGFIEQFPDVFARVDKMFLGPSDSNTIKIQVKGPDKDIIYGKAQEVMTLLRGIPNTVDVRQDWENLIVKVQVQVDQHRARRAGITSEDIANELQGYFSGAMVTEYREDDDIIPVVFRAKESERFNLDRLRTVSIYSSKLNQAVPLFQVADFGPVYQFAQIQRENLFRTVSVQARNLTMSAEDLKSVIDADIRALASDLPLNHSIEYDGVIVESAGAAEALSANMPMAIGVIIILLVLQFNSFRRAGIILLTIPLSIIGTVIGLLLMNAPSGFMVTLGIYSLAGIIINNAIVLIDRIDIERNSGKDAYDAIVDACITRLRPITMTTITTIMGLLPLIVFKDPLFYGMAVVIAFGLGVGTLLTLGVVPVLYAAFYRVKQD